MTRDETDVHARLQTLAAQTPASHDQRIREHARKAFRDAPRSTPRLPLALAATVLLAAPLAWYVANRADTVPTTEVLRDAAVEVQPAPGAVLADPPAVLSWRPVAGIRDYRVVLMDADAETLWRSETTVDPQVAVPQELEPLLRDQALIWRVELTGPGRPAPLGPYDFRVR